MMIDELYEAIRSMPAAEGLALAGSRASGNQDAKSDYDIYVYGDSIVDVETRQKLIAPLCSYSEIGNRYFEPEDNVILNDGTPVDIIYRTFDKFENGLEFVLDKHMPMNGYTTCFWHNIKTCRIIFDKTGKLTKLVEKAQSDYPEELRKSIIERNMKLLSGYMPSYDAQIKKAFGRNDLVSVNHRVSAFLESYFDVIFAINKLTHPGEKKLVDICKRDCKILPEKFEENINALFDKMFKEDTTEIVADMVAQLKKIV